MSNMDQDIANHKAHIAKGAALRQRMDYIEHGGATLRCHTMPIVNRESVAAHSFGVAWWAWLLTDGECPAALIMHALAHDLAEHLTGDIPSPAKGWLDIAESTAKWEAQSMRENGINLPPLTPREDVILRLADALDLMQFCVRERHLGNRSTRLNKMYYNIRDYLGKLSLEVTQTIVADNLDSAFRAIKDKWEDV